MIFDNAVQLFEILARLFENSATNALSCAGPEPRL
jgi:hypothetical protein